jgi:hypothetical protein
VSTVDSRLVFRSFGLIAEITTDDPRLRLRLAEALPPGAVPADGQPPSVRFRVTHDRSLLVDGVVVATVGSQVAPTIRELTRTIRNHIAGHAPDFVFVHAGVIAIGKLAIVIPGRSLSGKTTLVAALIEAGATYYSDEYAVIGAGGLLHPYPQPISLRYDPRSSGVMVPVPVAAEQLGRRPIAPGLVVLTRYRPGTDWEPARLAPAEAALALLEHTVAVRSRPVDALAVLRRLCLEAPVLTGPRGEATATGRALVELATDYAEHGQIRLESRRRPAP